MRPEGVLCRYSVHAVAKLQQLSGAALGVGRNNDSDVCATLVESEHCLTVTVVTLPVHLRVWSKFFVKSAIVSTRWFSTVVRLYWPHSFAI